MWGLNVCVGSLALISVVILAAKAYSISLVIKESWSKDKRTHNVET